MPVLLLLLLPQRGYSAVAIRFNWTKTVAGATGRALTNIAEKYLKSSASSGITIAGNTWFDAPPTLDATNKYLWNYTVSTFSLAPTSVTTVPGIIGVYGDQGLPGAGGETGSPGRSLSNMTSYYRLHTASTGITVGSGSWSTTIPTLTATDKYLWQYIKSDYINPTSSSDSTPVVIGTYGDQGLPGGIGNTGPTGRSVVTIVDEYYLSTSASSCDRRELEYNNASMGA